MRLTAAGGPPEDTEAAKMLRKAVAHSHGFKVATRALLPTVTIAPCLLVDTLCDRNPEATMPSPNPPNLLLPINGFATCEWCKLQARKGNRVEIGMVSWLTRMREAQAEMAARNADPWRLRLERLRGKIGDDNVERIGTQAIFDVLEVPQRNRGAGACKRLARLMRELGWSPIKARGLNQKGLLEQIRGYARDPRGSPLS